MRVKNHLSKNRGKGVRITSTSVNSSIRNGSISYKFLGPPKLAKIIAVFVDINQKLYAFWHQMTMIKGSCKTQSSSIFGIILTAFRFFLQGPYTQVDITPDRKS